jgi:PAS domain S-box-containing protein
MVIRLRPLWLLLAAALTTQMMWPCTTMSAAPPPPKTVLTVYWSSEDFPSNPVIDDALREVLRSRPSTPVDYFAEYLESDRFPEEEASLALRDYIRQKYRGRHIDLVFAVSEVALTFVLRFRDELFPGVPIVYSAVAALDPSTGIAESDLAGVLVGTSYAETLDLMLRLHPSVRKVIVIAQAPGSQLFDIVRRDLNAFSQRVELQYLTATPVERLIDSVKAVPKDSLILYVRYSQEEPGNLLFPNDVARLVTQASRVPVYGISERYMDTGVVGGAMYSSRALGIRLAQIGQRFLEGKRPDARVERTTIAPTFDWRQIQRWKINPSQLPPQSDIRFKEPTTWDRYRWYIIGAIALALFQTAMIAALTFERSRRRQAQTRYAMATAAGGVGVWEWNLNTNEIQVDASLKATLGYADDEMVIHFDDLVRLIHPDDLPAVMARARELANGARPSYEMEFRLLHRDGGTRWILSRGSQMRGSGDARHLTGTYIDITDRKLSERALAEAQAELTRVSRLTALGEFAATIAHEVRQPLTSIVMNARTCLRWLSSPAPDFTEIRAALSDVVDAGGRANELIQRNQQLFKQRTVEKEPLDIHDVIREVVVLAAARFQASQISLVLSFAPELPGVVGDRLELQQVIFNLLLNSIDATESVAAGQRRIEVSTSHLPIGMVQISVSDNGIGLDGVDTQRMFSLFYTTKANGTGIGLSLSRSIVEAHGGQLWAETNPYGGATFTFTVPVSSPIDDAIDVDDEVRTVH